MTVSKNKKKIVYTGDINSINLEIIFNSFKYLKNKVNYILISDKKDLIDYQLKTKSNILIQEIYDPISLKGIDRNKLNVFNVSSKNYSYKLINQLKISNQICNLSNFDLVTMPINKNIFKKKDSTFIGVTEYLGKINNTQTVMLMHGENFSIIPITTHINLKEIKEYLNKKNLINFLNISEKFIRKKIYGLKFSDKKFLCYNPHCGEDKTIGLEDHNIKKILLEKFKNIKGPFSADSAFTGYKKNTLFFSTYHDQALIPFKILNKKGINMTLGLNYKRISPAHGTAVDKKFKNLSDNTSYLKCMLS